MKIKISPFADEYIDESVKYYNNQKDGLGTEFAKEVNETFKRIKENPKQFPSEYKQLQRAGTRRFPFNVFFVVKDFIGYVLGVFHTSRNPKVMKERYKYYK